ncbi:Zn-dependent protease with chaperone function [Thiovulum sp. ES]|nr:Zn-dependent protease with chaperone function [Thiovulum sp. ES]
MITFISTFFFIYIAVKLYISVMQIGFVSENKKKDPFILSPDEYLKAGEYSVGKERLSLISTILEYGLFIFWINDGMKILSSLNNDFSETLQTLSFIFGFLFINMLVNLPLDFYQKFVLDQKFGFNKSSKILFLTDTLKEILLTLAIGTPIILGMVYFIENSENWWLWSFGIMFSFVLFANMLYPTVIAPLFNKMSPLEDKELNSKIEGILSKVGFKSSGVFTIDASKRDGRLNAYFGGLGSAKRVVLFDTLLEKLNHGEILAVLGHELGHFKNGDIYKNIGIMGGILFALFYLIGHVPDSLFEILGIEKNSETLLVILMLFSSPILFFVMPIFGYISRRNEYGADKVGSELAGSSLLLKEALKKLVVENKAFPKSHKIYIFFYYTHPPLSERLEHLEKL